MSLLISLVKRGLTFTKEATLTNFKEKMAGFLVGLLGMINFREEIFNQALEEKKGKIRLKIIVKCSYKI